MGPAAAPGQMAVPGARRYQKQLSTTVPALVENRRLAYRAAANL